MNCLVERETCLELLGRIVEEILKLSREVSTTTAKFAASARIQAQ